MKANFVTHTLTIQSGKCSIHMRINVGRFHSSRIYANRETCSQTWRLDNHSIVQLTLTETKMESLLWQLTSIPISIRWTWRANDLHKLALLRSHSDDRGPNPIVGTDLHAPGVDSPLQIHIIADRFSSTRNKFAIMATGQPIPIRNASQQLKSVKLFTKSWNHMHPIQKIMCTSCKRFAQPSSVATTSSVQLWNLNYSYFNNNARLTSNVYADCCNMIAGMARPTLPCSARCKRDTHQITHWSERKTTDKHIAHRIPLDAKCRRLKKKETPWREERSSSRLWIKANMETSWHKSNTVLTRS